MMKCSFVAVATMVPVVCYVLLLVLLWLTQRPEPLSNSGLEMWSGGVIVAHRAGKSFACENTLYAIEHAARVLRVKAVEIDVQLTRDGVPVIIHNVRLDGVTNGSGLISEVTREQTEYVRLNFEPELAPDACRGKNSTAFRGGIPTLDQVVKLVIKLDLLLLIDVKEHVQWLRIADILVVYFAKYNLYRRAIVGSFNPVLLHRVRQNPRINTIMFKYPENGLQALCRNPYVLPHPPSVVVCQLAPLIDPLIDWTVSWLPSYLGAGIVGHHWLSLEADMPDVVQMFRRNVTNVYVVNSSERRAAFQKIGAVVMSDCPVDGVSCREDIMDRVVRSTLHVDLS